MNGNKIVYFDSIEVEHIPKEIKKFTGNKNIITNIYRIQAYNSIMRGYFCIWFIDFMLKSKSFLDYTNLLSPNDYGKNVKNNTKIFSITKKIISYYKKLYYIICGNYREFEKPKISYILEKNISSFYY